MREQRGDESEIAEDRSEVRGRFAAPSRRVQMAGSYPALARALEAHSDAPTIHDAANAAVESKDSGAPVESAVAGRVGAHLGVDFGAVRVHGDPLAREATQAMGARAFAYGADVFLGPDESSTDLGLMAHELTHVAQQGAAGQRAPQRQVQVGDAGTPAEQEADRVADDVAQERGGAAALIVDNPPVATGQMLKSTFIAQLRDAVTQAANAELGPAYSAIGCPYIEQYFGRYSNRPASEGEALLRRFAPDVRPLRAAADMIPVVVARVHDGVRHWRDTGKPPAELIAAGAVAPEFGSADTPSPADNTAVSATSTQTVSPVAAPLRAPDTLGSLASLESQLGPGQAVDAANAGRVADVLGVDVSNAKIHTGPVAARTAAAANALAFTVGPNIVMGTGAPSAGSLEGDALLAHELTHVAQQSSASANPAARTQPIEGESSAAEDHADQAAAAVVAKRQGVSGMLQRLGSSLRSGLQLQRCESQADKYKKRIAELQKTEAAKSSFGSVAAAATERRATEHWLAVEEGNKGPRTGTESGESGLPGCNCTTYVVDMLKQTFTAMGQSVDWTKVEKKALANNGPGQTGMNGIPIQQALESEFGWKGVFWAPDPNFKYKKKDGTDDTEHAYAYSTAKKGKYYKVTIDQTVVNFAPENGSTTAKDTTGLEKLKKIPFGVLTARGARHMALIVRGVVYEVHWDQASKSAGLYGATPLENWSWDSGAVVAPAADVAVAFAP